MPLIFICGAVGPFAEEVFGVSDIKWSPIGKSEEGGHHPRPLQAVCRKLGVCLICIASLSHGLVVMESLSKIPSCDALFERLTNPNNVIFQESFVAGIHQLLTQMGLVSEPLLTKDRRKILEGSFKQYATGEDMTKAEFAKYFAERVMKFLKEQVVVGIDVGGTNTDAVILRLPDNTVVDSIKTLTTPDIKTGVLTAIRHLKDSVAHVMDCIDIVIIGTTAFVNSVIQCSNNLSKVCLPQPHQTNLGGHHSGSIMHTSPTCYPLPLPLGARAPQDMHYRYMNSC